MFTKRMMTGIAAGLITLGAIAGLAGAKGAANEPAGAPKHVGEVVAPAGGVTPPPVVHGGKRP